MKLCFLDVRHGVNLQASLLITSLSTPDIQVVFPRASFHGIAESRVHNCRPKPRFGCFIPDVPRAIASRFFYGTFPLALNLGLHTSLAAAHCRDWTSVALWVATDCATICWRCLRARNAGAFRWKCLDSTPWLGTEGLRQRLSFEAIVLGWGLTSALTSLLLFSPLAWVLPHMLQDFLFTQGLTSAKYVAVVWMCDVSADILSALYLTRLCDCDFGYVLGHPCSKALGRVYVSSLSVIWAPCALGCFGWVFQHMCVASFQAQC